LEEFGNGKGKLANASEEGQGPRRAVEPMMMMIRTQNKIEYPTNEIKMVTE
jgi:hypothetical protein